MPNSVVSGWLMADLHLTDRQVLRLPVPYTFTAAQPLWVRFEFLLPEGTVAWDLSRDLLRHGTRQLAGLGDVRVRPRDSTPARTQVELRSPAGVATLDLLTGDLLRLLDRTEQLVPLGAENLTAAVDGALAALLHHPGHR
jgi:hypothetical protein